MYQPTLLNPAWYDSTVVCECSGWNFSISPANPFEITPLSNFTTEINVIDWIPSIVTSIQGTVPDARSFRAWNLAGLSLLGTLTLATFNPADWPLSIDPSTFNNTDIPYQLGTLDMYGSFTSLPQNVFGNNSLTYLKVLVNSLTSVPPVSPANSPNSITVFIQGLNLSTPFPDLSLFNPNLVQLTLVGTAVPSFTANAASISPISQCTFSISSSQITFEDLSAWNCYGITIELDSSTTLCNSNNCTFNANAYTISLILPQVTSLPSNLFPNGGGGSISIKAPISIIPSLPLDIEVLYLENIQIGSSLNSMIDFATQTPSLMNLAIVNSSSSAFPIGLSPSLIRYLWISNVGLTTSNIDSELSKLVGLSHLQLDHNGLTSLPSLCNLTALSYLDLSFNQLTSMPNCSSNFNLLQFSYLNDNLLSDFQSLMPYLRSYNYWQNNLLGTDPNGIPIFPPASDTNFVSIDLTNNAFSGSITGPGWTSIFNYTAYLILANNDLTGTINPAVVSSVISGASLDLSFNQLSGSIPIALLCTGTNSYSNLVLRGNSFSGWINMSSGDCSSSRITTLDVGENQITYYPPALDLVSGWNNVYWDSNPMTGSIPVRFAQSDVGILNMSSCGLSQPFDEWASHLQLGNFPRESLDFSNNNLSGTIPLAALFFSYVSLANNQISGTLPGYNLSSYRSAPAVGVLDLSSNDIQGWIPSYLPFTTYTHFDFSGNQWFAGPFPFLTPTPPSQYPSPPVTYFGSAGTYLDMCSPSSFELVGTGHCSFNNTNICLCVDHYPYCDNLPPCPPTNSCSGAAPGPYFLCIDGTWLTVSPSFFDYEIIVGGATNIIGNMSTPGILVAAPLNSVSQLGGFGPSGSSPLVTVNGCANISSITLKLSSDDIDHLIGQHNQQQSVQLVNQQFAAGCPNILSLISLSVTIDSSVSPCKKVSSSTNDSPNSLTAIFSVDTSTCNNKNSNTWKIIVGSVVGGVGVIAIGIVIAFLASPKLRMIIIPYSA